MKRVLIVAYYWPPSGGAGVQRWVMLIKYLAEFGWEPVIYTPFNPETPLQDESLLKEIPQGLEVVKHPIWEPYSFYKKLVGNEKDEKVSPGVLINTQKKGVAERLSVWIRGNFFIPDARVYWVRPSIRKLCEYLNKNPVDAIVTTGPPHSMHLIGRGVKRKLSLTWVADFRDPWTNIHYHQELMLGAIAAKKHQHLEQSVLQEADHIVTASFSMTQDFETIVGEKVTTITNGFEPEEYIESGVEQDRKFSITHIGTLYESRNPLALWQALSELKVELDGFKEQLVFRLVGKTAPGVLEAITAHGLTENLENIGYVSKSEVPAYQQRSAVLLLIYSPEEKTIIPGKLFEYLASQRPIVCIADLDWDAPRLIADFKAGETQKFENKEGMKSAFRNAFFAHQNGIEHSFDRDLNAYTRRNLARKYAGLLSTIQPAVSA